MQGLITGDWNDPQFSDVLAALGSEAIYCDFDRLADLDKVLTAGASAPRTVDLLVLVQAHRDQYDPGEAQRWLGRFPEAIPLHVVGSWCEGEGRSGNILSGWRRLPWHRWPAVYAELSASRFSEHEADAQAERQGERDAPRIGLIGRGASEIAALREACGQLGYRVVAAAVDRATAEPSAAPLWLVAADSLDPWLSDVVGALAAAKGRRLVVLMNFPRLHELEAIDELSRGRAHVLGKPFELAHLAWALRPPQDDGGLR